MARRKQRPTRRSASLAARHSHAVFDVIKKSDRDREFRTVRIAHEALNGDEPHPASSMDAAG
jgi:hypothetical protein